jgi:Tfp pilus assembly protein PilV
MSARSVRRRLDARGISVVELLVGVVLLAVVVVSLAGASMYASRMLTRSQVSMESTEFQQSELERILAVPYDSLASGSRATEVGESEWTVTDLGTHRRILLITHYAPTSAISVKDTLVAFKLVP